MGWRPIGRNPHHLFQSLFQRFRWFRRDPEARSAAAGKLPLMFRCDPEAQILAGARAFSPCHCAAPSFSPAPAYISVARSPALALLLHFTLFSALRSRNRAAQTLAAAAVSGGGRRRSHDRDPPALEVTHSGVLPHLVTHLATHLAIHLVAHLVVHDAPNSRSLQFEAAMSS